MGILDDYKTGTNFRPETNFRPQAFNQQAASPMANMQQGTNRKSAHLPYEETMQEASKQYNVPYNILFNNLKQESQFDPNAVSKTGARGIAQFMPKTAKDMGLEDPHDPIKSIFASAKYLRQLHNQFGDWKLAVAGYNAGPDAVTKAGNKIPNISETINHVDKVFPDGMSPHMQEGFGATPSGSTQQPQAALTGMNQDQMRAVNDAMPETSRSIQTIRGNTEGWYNPQQSREFATLGESMRGEPGEATYQSRQVERMGEARNAAGVEATRVENTLKNQGAMDQLAETRKILGEQGTGAKSAKDALAAVEGGPGPGDALAKNEAEKAANNILSEEEQRELEEDKKKKERAASLNRWYSTPANSGT
jgi:hypothetical protein